MIDKVEKKDCAGCGACAAVCPGKALTLREDADGFRYPVCDPSRCVDCSLCEEACPVLHAPERKEPETVWAACASEDRIRMRAASGGAFTALAETFLAKGGAAYGCAMEFDRKRDKDGKERLRVCLRHVRAADPGELAALGGSKYAQSRTEEAYVHVLHDLKDGRDVLFSGTPCQCAGLRQYLTAKRADQSRLYLADILCHGVPSEKMFRLYLRYLGRKHHGEVTAYQFRDKERGFTYFPKYRIRRGEKEKWEELSTMEEGYWYIFQHALANRENCYRCPYASTERTGDLTLGDYWGIEQAHPELLTDSGGPLPREKGVSLVLANTQKGRKLLQDCGEKLILCGSTLEKALVRGDALKHPSAEPPERPQVLAALREGYAGAAGYVRKAMGAGYYKSVLKEKAGRVLHR